MASLRRAHLVPLLAACIGPACTDRDPMAMTTTSSGSSSGSAPLSTSTTPTTSGDPGTSAGPTTTSGATTGPDDTATTVAPDPTTGGVDETTFATTISATDSMGSMDSTGSTGSTNSTDSTDDTGVPGECQINPDCASSACLEFRDFDPAAVCVGAPPGGATRFPGTVVDFVTGVPRPLIDLKIVGVLEALLDPDNATPVVTGMSDAAGIVDITSDGPVVEGIGVVALVGSDGPLFTTLTAAASPMQGVYGPMSDNHDFWVVPTAVLAEWSGFLMQEPALAADLPLGVNGGTLGLVRDEFGGPVAGAVVESVNPDSSAEIRYLEEDKQGFGAGATASSGVFVVLGPGLAEKFQVVGVPAASEAAASVEGAIFVMTLDVP